VIVRVDIHKAYNSLERHTITAVMEHMGFPVGFAQLVARMNHDSVVEV